MSKQDLATIDAKIKRWQTRLTRAVNAINKLERQARRLVKKEHSKLNVAYAEINKAIAKVAFTEPPKDAGTVVPEAIKKVDDGLDIPPSLLRSEPAKFNKYEAEHKAQKQKKAKASAEKRKGIAAEHKKLDTIPKSKLRWDTNKSQWKAD